MSNNSHQKERDHHFFKPIDYNWSDNLFGLLICYYVQPFIFSLRGELLLPTLRRTKKIAKISVFSEGVIFVFIGFLGYFFLGDNFTPKLFILRKFDEQNHILRNIFIFIIAVFFVLNTLGLSMYNPSIRNYIGTFMDVDKTRLRYVLVSLVPFALICFSASRFPYINKTLNIFGYTVFNFNGYIIPFLMFIAVNKRRNAPMWQVVCGWAGLAFFISLGVCCIIFLILGKITL